MTESPAVVRRERQIRLLLAIIGLEVLLLLAHGRWTRQTQPPQADLTGYPAVTRRTVTAARDHVRQQPADTSRWSRLGDTLFACGRYAAAEACYREAVVRQPESAQCRYDLGFCLMSTGRLQEANTAFAEAAARAPALAPTQHYYAALNALRNGDADTARAELIQAGSLPVAQLELAVLDLREGHTDAAEPRLLQLQQQRPNASRVHQLLAGLYAQTDRPQQARQSRQLAELLSGIVAGPWNERAALLLDETRQLTVADQVSRLAARLSTATGPNSGTPTAALRRLREDITTDLEQQWDPLLEDVLADVAAAAGDQLQQCQHLRNIIDRDGGSTYRLNRLGFALLNVGERQAGRDALEAGFRLAHAATDAAGVDNCFALAELTREENPGRSALYLARGHRLAGLLAMDQQQFADAIEQFAASLRADADQPEVWFWQARTARLLGQVEIARKACQQCLQHDPQHRQARQLADELAGSISVPDKR